MIVPQFWAEARLQQPRAQDRLQITVRRFGWSETSQTDAQRMADERVREAFERAISGDKLDRREPKVAYNGAQGVPIREEVLSRHGDVVITRNAYGAHCLNTSDVLFADVDFASAIDGRIVLGSIVVLLTTTWIASFLMRSVVFGVVGSLVALVLGWQVAKLWQHSTTGLRGGPEQQARQRVQKFLARHPDWQVRVYRTPAGLRVLVMHALFSAQDPAVAEFFAALKVDPVYARMCRNQSCFRARLTPKPWRVGIRQHLKPRPGIWPVGPARLPQRTAWIHEYERAAAGFAACCFVDEIGSGVVHAKADAVRELHDRLSLALTGRDMA